MTGFAQRYRPGAGMAEAFSTWIESLLGPHGLVVFESADPAAKRARGARLRARARIARTDRGARRRRRATQLPRAATSRRSCRNPAASALFHLDGARLPIRRRRRPLSHRRHTRHARRAQAGSAGPIQRSSAPTCCCGRSCRTRSSRRSVMWPARASSHISASFAASTNISACRCR